MVRRLLAAPKVSPGPRHEVPANRCMNGSSGLIAWCVIPAGGRSVSKDDGLGRATLPGDGGLQDAAGIHMDMIVFNS